MKTIVVLTSCIALASVALVNGEDANKKKNKGVAAPAGHVQRQHAPKANLVQGQHHLRQNNNLPANQSNNAAFKARTFNKTVNHTHVTNNTTINKTVYKGQHFKLAGPNANIPAVRYRAGVHIAGSHAWVGPQYVVFRNYSPVWHDRGWWSANHSNIVFVFGAPYYWESGYWYPAWGYDPGARYYYDGPIYASSPAVDPSQEVAQVQSVLQDQGYYTGEIDGVLGPLTRAAIASYQQEHGLYTTSAIDQPTLESLGLT